MSDKSKENFKICQYYKNCQCQKVKEKGGTAPRHSELSVGGAYSLIYHCIDKLINDQLESCNPHHPKFKNK